MYKNLFYSIITNNLGSKCGVSLVDKSVDILGNDNKVILEKYKKLCSLK